MKYITVTVFGAFGFLASCGLSETQCVQGDWVAIGKSDGLQGRSADYVDKHAKSCGKHDISVNQSLWQRGRQEGLKTYCTPESAYALGRNGRSLRQVCPNGNQATLEAAQAKGKKYYEIRQDINHLEHEKDSLRYDIGNLHRDPANPETVARIGYMRSQILQLELQINHLHIQLRRYAQL